MSKIVNIQNETTDLAAVNRGQIEHRATWMGLIYDEMKKAGIDGEAVIRRAIRRCGNLHGERFKAQCRDPANAAEFREVFLPDLGVQTFNMDGIRADHDNVETHFHYCALVSAWQKLGFDDETCALLCDMAMDGDRGIAEAMGLTLDLTETIAAGCPACKLHFHK